jgi:hypothetical protein
MEVIRWIFESLQKPAVLKKRLAECYTYSICCASRASRAAQIGLRKSGTRPINSPGGRLRRQGLSRADRLCAPLRDAMKRADSSIAKTVRLPLPASPNSPPTGPGPRAIMPYGRGSMVTPTW